MWVPHAVHQSLLLAIKYKPIRDVDVERAFKNPNIELNKDEHSHGGV